MHRHPSMGSAHSPAVPPQHFDPRFGPPPGMGGFNPGMHPGHNAGPPAQFFGGVPGGTPGHIQHEQIGFSPIEPRRMTRGMNMSMDGFPGMYGQ
jgi:hypothetical protein